MQMYGAMYHETKDAWRKGIGRIVVEWGMCEVRISELRNVVWIRGLGKGDICFEYTQRDRTGEDVLKLQQ